MCENPPFLLLDTPMSEDEYPDEDMPPLRKVKVQPYGSHGIMPANPEDCPYRGENACISASGMSQCGALYEDEEIEPGKTAAIQCIEEQTFSAEAWDALHPSEQAVNDALALMRAAAHRNNSA
jgi:hypothetical protein